MSIILFYPITASVKVLLASNCKIRWILQQFILMLNVLGMPTIRSNIHMTKSSFFSVSKKKSNRFQFLVADTQLYKRLCPSVGRSVGPLVGPWTRVEKGGNERFRTFLVADSCISAPAHPSATGGRVSGLVSQKILIEFFFLHSF